MKLKLNRPIVFFDLETTGINVAKDRIVEIAILKVFPNGNTEGKKWLVNPEMEIPKASSDIHGITNEMVVTQPTFKELANQITELIKDCDLAGYNSNRFDIPLLAEEMLRAGVNFNMENRVAIDVQVVFHKKEQRTLSAAYQFYCNKDLKDAHSAMADTTATYEVLKSQLDKYQDLENDVAFLSQFSQQKKNVDFAGFISYDENEEEIFSFGKYKGRKVADVLKENSGYFGWIQNADFPLYTKKVLASIKDKIMQKKEEEKISLLKNKFNSKN